MVIPNVKSISLTYFLPFVGCCSPPFNCLVASLYGIFFSKHVVHFLQLKILKETNTMALSSIRLKPIKLLWLSDPDFIIAACVGKQKKTLTLFAQGYAVAPSNCMSMRK